MTGVLWLGSLGVIVCVGLTGLFSCSGPTTDSIGRGLTCGVVCSGIGLLRFRRDSIAGEGVLALRRGSLRGLRLRLRGRLCLRSRLGLRLQRGRFAIGDLI